MPEGQCDGSEMALNAPATTLKMAEVGAGSLRRWQVGKCNIHCC